MPDTVFEADYHIHTRFCDGADSAEDMVKEALKKGLKILGFSGHMDPECGVSMDIGAYTAAVRKLQKEYEGQIEILLGGEVDCLFEPEMIPELDYRIGSTHSLRMPDGRMFSVDDTPEILEGFCRDYYGGDHYALAKAYFEKEAEIADRVKPDIIGHFDLITRFNDDLHYIDEEDPGYLRYALGTMRYLTEKGIPFEINCGAVNRKRKKEFYPSTTLLKELKNMGGKIVFGSDAHEAAKITGGFDAALKKALECGFESALFLCHDEHGSIVFREIPLTA